MGVQLGSELWCGERSGTGGRQVPFLHAPHWSSKPYPLIFKMIFLQLLYSCRESMWGMDPTHQKNILCSLALRDSGNKPWEFLLLAFWLTLETYAAGNAQAQCAPIEMERHSVHISSSDQKDVPHLPPLQILYRKYAVSQRLWFPLFILPITNTQVFTVKIQPK